MDLKVNIFSGGADKAAIMNSYAKPGISGFTTNPTLMHKAGIADYEAFARDILAAIPDRPFSLEVFVKIPVTNTRREPSLDLICRLSHSGVKVNVTGLMTLAQVRDVSQALSGGAPSYVSVFAGRMADTGVDPVPIMTAAVEMLPGHPGMELIWAGLREILNVVQADRIGCHIITITSDILRKLDLLGKHLADYPLETVQMFYDDAMKSGFSI
jgi:transaldolase